MPEKIGGAEETRVTELQNAAAEVAASAEVEQAFRHVRAGGVAP